MIHAFGDTYAHSQELGDGSELLDPPIRGHLFRWHNPDHISNDPLKYIRYLNDLGSTLSVSNISGVNRTSARQPKISALLENYAFELMRKKAMTPIGLMGPDNGSFGRSELQWTTDEFSSINTISGYDAGRYNPVGGNVVPSSIDPQDAIGQAKSMMEMLKKAINKGGCCD